MASPATAKPLTVRCQCGHVSFPTPTAQPLSLFYCHCTECQKQTSSAFGTSAIYPASGLFPLPPQLAARMRVFRRAPHATNGRSQDCYFCAECGSRLLHRIVDADGRARDTVSVKGGCIEGLEWRWETSMHIFVRSAVIPLPEGFETYETIPAWMQKSLDGK
ncbi:Mss4-like protein [Hypoxylon fragiforme]|uniref:Mss4-like protein n=1 Tax=Hypoxylon fragiforme TaxID=63214 RepID=UPI0020C6585C|nr:Mss4-like protein [Hypoxylon fragiforme]KAI2603130.1 Mss4-like protein [Hypoxylon fragiforme]